MHQNHAPTGPPLVPIRIGPIVNRRPPNDFDRAPAAPLAQFGAWLNPCGRRRDVLPPAMATPHLINARPSSPRASIHPRTRAQGLEQQQERAITNLLLLQTYCSCCNVQYVSRSGLSQATRRILLVTAPGCRPVSG
jgi:hypothetical protein